MSVPFINNLSAGADSTLSHAHEHGDAVHSHEHGGEHGHTHEHLDHPGMYHRSLSIPLMDEFHDRQGKFAERDLPDYTSRNFHERGFTVGIGGYVHMVSLFVSPSHHLQTGGVR